MPDRNQNLPPCLRLTDAGSVLSVRIQPRASKDEIVGLHGDALKLRVTAPPVDSAANEAVLRLLSKALSLPKSAVRLLKGQASRNKQILLDGVRPEDLPPAFLRQCQS